VNSDFVENDKRERKGGRELRFSWKWNWRGNWGRTGIEMK